LNLGMFADEIREWEERKRARHAND
jgi:hypothetical protein